MLSRRFLLLLVVCLVLGCSQEPGKPTLRLAVTTSTRDSGLLEHIIPSFEATKSVRVDVVAVGTGAALKLGAVGDVDAVVCHAQAAELQFMKAGHGIRREPFMRNSFLILGPKSDPAQIRSLSPVAALSAIKSANGMFVSRGDQSGTHQCELRLWKVAADMPTWPEYYETGQGMGQSLIIADQKQGYVLTDRGTYLKFRSKLELQPLVTDGVGLENPYGVLVVNPNKNPSNNGLLAQAFADFLISPATQRAIAAYRVDDEPLFDPLRLASAD